MSTVHGPEAMRLVGIALTDAGILVPRTLRATLVSNALAVAEGRATREGAIDRLEATAINLERPHLTKLLDTAVEALTADPQETPDA